MSGKFGVALCCQYGRGTVANTDAAVHWLREAAQQGHVMAMALLAAMLQEGVGSVRPNAEESFEWYLGAAKVYSYGPM